MLGLRKRQEERSLEARDLTISKLFFDTFSNRLHEVEGKLQALSTNVEKMKLSTERMQVSDLVLLEKIQKTDEALKESLGWTKKTAESIPGDTLREKTPSLLEIPAARVIVPQSPIQPFSVPTTDGSILSGLANQTELQVIMLLSAQGSQSAPEIGRLIGRSREHTARLLKKLYEEGYVKRDQARVPFRYSLVEQVRASLRKGEEKLQGEESAPVSVPPA